MLGDFNVDFAQLGSMTSRTSVDFKHLLHKHQLDQSRTSPTRSALKSSTILDHIYSNGCFINTWATIENNMSDHLPIFLVWKKSKTKCDHYTFTARNVKNSKPQNFEEHVSATDWKELFECRDVDRCWDIILQVIKSYLDRDCPIYNFYNVQVQPRWISVELRSLMNNQDKLFRKAKKSKDPEDWINAKWARNIVNEQSKGAKSEYINNNLNLNKPNPHKFWQIIQPLISPEKVKSSSKVTLEDNTGVKIDLNDIQDTFNDFFFNVGPDLASKVPEANIAGRELVNDKCNSVNPFAAEFGFIEIMPATVDRHIKQSHIYKNSGIEYMPTKILKPCLLFLIPQLCYLFNLSLEVARVPVLWKQATVTPLFKEGSKKLSTNNRPISSISLPSKLL